MDVRATQAGRPRTLIRANLAVDWRRLERNLRWNWPRPLHDAPRRGDSGRPHSLVVLERRELLRDALDFLAGDPEHLGTIARQ